MELEPEAMVRPVVLKFPVAFITDAANVSPLDSKTTDPVAVTDVEVKASKLVADAEKFFEVLETLARSTLAVPLPMYEMSPLVVEIGLAEPARMSYELVLSLARPSNTISPSVDETVTP